MFDKALNGADIHRCWYEAVLDELGMDLGGIKPGKGLLEAEDFLHGRVGERAGASFVRAFVGQKCVESEALVKGYPLFNGFVADFPDGAIGKLQRVFRDAFVVCGSGSVGKQALDHGSDQCKAELGHFGCGYKIFVFIHDGLPSLRPS